MSQLFDLLQSSEDITNTYLNYVTNADRKNHFLGKAILQLTPVCNFACKMCYAKMTHPEISRLGKHVLGYEEWKWFIDRFYEMGTKVLTFTGGECMVHPDFKEIYNYSYDKGFNIAILTNGACISDDLLELFRNKPPEIFSITVYGGCPETYKKLCGNGNAYFDVYRNISKLQKTGFNLLVKYTITSANIDDFPNVYLYFKERDIKLRYYSELMTYNKSDASIVKEMSVNKNLLREKEKRILSDIVQFNLEEQDSQCVAVMHRRCRLSQNGIRCSAGRSVCYIRWDGLMTPCVSFDHLVLNPREIGVEESWKKMNEWADNYPAMVKCDGCLHSTKCVQCAAIHFNDTGIPGIPSPRLCWKNNNPVEASIIEKRCIDKGLIAADELDE